MKRVVNRRRKPGEIPARSLAIRLFCRECVGWHRGDDQSIKENISKCPAEECWLWPYRNGTVERD